MDERTGEALLVAASSARMGARDSAGDEEREDSWKRSGTTRRCRSRADN